MDNDGLLQVERNNKNPHSGVHRMDNVQNTRKMPCVPFSTRTVSNDMTTVQHNTFSSMRFSLGIYNDRLHGNKPPNPI